MSACSNTEKGMRNSFLVGGRKNLILNQNISKTYRTTHNETFTIKF